MGSFRPCTVAVALACWAAGYVVVVADDASPAPGSFVPITLEGGTPIDPAAFLDALQQRDRQFDNITLNIEKSWVETVNPRSLLNSSRRNAMRFGLDPDKHALKVEGEIPEPYEQPHRVHYAITIRGPAVTLEGGEELEKIRHPMFSSQPSRGLKWGNEGGLEKAFDENGEDSTLRIRHGAGPDSALEFKRDCVEFACGYGFGRRLLGVEQCVERDGLKICLGRLRFGVSDEQECRLEVDRDWIVRRAEIVLRNPQDASRITVTTDGIVRPESVPPVAATGVVQREIIHYGPHGDRLRADVILNESQRFLAVTTGLSDEKYKAISAVQSGAKSLVVNIGGPPSSSPVRTSPR